MSIGQVNRLVRTEEEAAKYLKELLEKLKGQGIALSETCRRYVLSWCNEPVEPRGSIKSVLATKLTLWSSPLVDRATEDNDFDLRDFRRKGISLYISIAPDDLKKLAAHDDLPVRCFSLGFGAAVFLRSEAQSI